VDRESAYEKLRGRAAAATTAGSAAGTGSSAPSGGGSSVLRDVLFGTTGPRGGHHEGMLDVVAKSAARAAGSQLGRQILRGVFGSILRGK
jgi:DNA double-strand break repair helicase HerA and related ATPase